MKKVVLIPSYEPDDKLIKLVKNLSKEDLDVIVVDDGSGNKYKDIFKEVEKYNKVISYKDNKGKGYALKTGFKYIKDKYKKDYVVVTMDSDGQHTIKDAKKLCDYCIENKDTLVLGKRIRSKKTPLRSRFGNWITKVIYGLTTGVYVYDTQTGLRAFSDNLMDFIINISGDRFEYEMNQLLEAAKNKIKIKELEIETIYIDNNKGTHFKAIKDSYLVYKDLIKFSASSFLSFIIDYLCYILFILIFSNIIISNILARIISASVNYTLNRNIVFNNKNKIYKTLSQYILLALAIIILNTLLLNLIVTNLTISPLLAKIIVEIIMFIISYLIQKKYIFKNN